MQFFSYNSDFYLVNPAYNKNSRSLGMALVFCLYLSPYAMEMVDLSEMVFGLILSPGRFVGYLERTKI